MPAERIVDGLNAQIGREFAASQQYLVMGLHYDGQALPRLAAFFYRQALEERDHGLMMARYLLDSDEIPLVGTLDAPRGEFEDAVAPIALAVEQEREVTGHIDDLMELEEYVERELAGAADDDPTAPPVVGA